MKINCKNCKYYNKTNVIKFSCYNDEDCPVRKEPEGVFENVVREFINRNSRVTAFGTGGDSDIDNFKPIFDYPVTPEEASKLEKISLKDWSGGIDLDDTAAMQRAYGVTPYSDKNNDTHS